MVEQEEEEEELPRLPLMQPLHRPSLRAATAARTTTTTTAAAAESAWSISKRSQLSLRRCSSWLAVTRHVVSVCNTQTHTFHRKLASDLLARPLAEPVDKLPVSSLHGAFSLHCLPLSL